MRRITPTLIVLLATFAVALVVSACGGGGSTDPEDAIGTAADHRDQLEGELLLAEVELDQAFLAQDEREATKKPRQEARAIADLLRSAQKVERRCREGDGLESCTELDAIEAVVGEIEGEARVGPSR
jgi:hypothetical protein